MKNFITIFCALIIVFSFVSCSSNDNFETISENITTEKAAVKAVDIDLTALSGTMVYGEVYNMMIYPDQYIGKTVKMQGQYNSFYDKKSGKTYYACVIADATACCQQGMEFELNDKNTVSDFVQNENIEVVGEFNTYNKGELKYFHLTNATVNKA